MYGLKLIIVIIFLLLVGFGFYYFLFLKNSNAEETNTLEKNLGSGGNIVLGLCFYKETGKKVSLLPSVYEMEVYIMGNQVEGSLSVSPENQNIKQGRFYGELSHIDDKWSVDAWWDAFESEKNTKEELKILFEDNLAKIGVGSMQDNGDGTFFYKNKNRLNYDLGLALTNCK